MCLRRLTDMFGTDTIHWFIVVSVKLDGHLEAWNPHNFHILERNGHAKTKGFGASHEHVKGLGSLVCFFLGYESKHFVCLETSSLVTNEDDDHKEGKGLGHMMGKSGHSRWRVKSLG